MAKAKLSQRERKAILNSLASFIYDMWREDPKGAAEELTEQAITRLSRVSDAFLIRELKRWKEEPDESREWEVGDSDE